MILHFELTIEHLPNERRFAWRHRNLLYEGNGTLRWSSWTEGRANTAAECLRAVQALHVELQGGGRWAGREWGPGPRTKENGE